LIDSLTAAESVFSECDPIKKREAKTTEIAVPFGIFMELRIAPVLIIASVCLWRAGA